MTYHTATCRQCPAQRAAHTEQRRTDWANEHTQETGHTVDLGRTTSLPEELDDDDT